MPRPEVGHTGSGHRGREPDILPAQCRAARALLRWSLLDVEKASGIHSSVVNAFERNARHLSNAEMSRLHAVFQRAGIEFLSGERIGVAIAVPQPATSDPA